ncbi:UNVERIFIED_CONTAM: hypothetical protein Sindi_1197400 [Sesamum indicum]
MPISTLPTPTPIKDPHKPIQFPSHHYGELHRNMQKQPRQRDESHANSEKMRIKIVLTRDELEQLLFQLNSSEGKRQLEDVLVEIQTSRAVWKPCLDSIIECPEVPEIMDG